MNLRSALAFCLLTSSIGSIAAIAIIDSPPPIDCSTVLCALPTKCSPEDIFTPIGQCCPICRPDCSTVLCAKPLCEKGETIETRPGQCCPECVKINCATVSCLRPVCPLGQTLEVPEGECCPVCVSNCAFKGQEFSLCSGCDSTCIDVINEEPRFCPAFCRPGCSCPGGQFIDTITGQCVPQVECTNPCAMVNCTTGFTCKVNRTTNEAFCAQCATTRCVEPICEKGQTIETPPGECCPVCKTVPPPNCAAVLCLALTKEDCAEQGKELVVPPGECCAICQRDCSAVSCLRPVCEDGQTLEVPEGECCPVCIPEESCPIEGQEIGECPGCDITCIDAINEEVSLCPAVCIRGCGCPSGQLIDTVTGQCVPQNKCTNPCASFDCGPGSSCRVDRETNKPFCTRPSCGLNNGGCAENEICQETIVQCLTTPCPPVIQCLSRETVCSLKPEVGPCDAADQRYFYNATSGQCELFTYGGCEGNANNFETAKECQRTCGMIDPCATVRCRAGHRCEVFQPTGEPFCTPDCSLSNGGCPRNETCTLEQVQCVRAPCPPVVQCLDQCARVRCSAGHRCDIDEATGQAFCNPDCNLDNGGCRSDQICELQPVTCVRAPCPPVVQCSCPPPCSKEYCSYNPRGLCSRANVTFGTQDIPGCSGDCQLTYCKACFSSRDVIPDGLDNCRTCSDPADYSSPSRCYRRWSRCAGKLYRRVNRPNRREYSTRHFKCASPPCVE